MNYVIDCVTRKYSQFSGRARRKEYWLFILTMFIAGIIFERIDLTLRPFGWFDMSRIAISNRDSGFGALSLAFSLVTLIPSTAVTVRRLHDTGRSGWWILLVLLPMAAVSFTMWQYSAILSTLVVATASGTSPEGLAIIANSIGADFFVPLIAFPIGLIVFLVFMCLHGTDGDNEYGPDPLEIRRPRLPEEM